RAARADQPRRQGRLGSGGRRPQRPALPPGAGMRRPALLVAGHGSQDAAGAIELLALADRVGALDPGLAVACGFVELSPPPLTVACADLVARGAHEIVVTPVMLLAAGHVKD